MEESDSGQQAKRCPCGFWGLPQNSGLCSKCYKATVQEKTQDGLDPKAELMRSTDRQSAYTSHDTLGASSSSFLTSSRTQPSAATMEKAEELLRQAVKNSQHANLELKDINTNNMVKVNPNNGVSMGATGSSSDLKDSKHQTLTASSSANGASDKLDHVQIEDCKSKASNDKVIETTKSIVSPSTSTSKTTEVSINIDLCEASNDKTKTDLDSESKIDTDALKIDSDALLTSPDKRGIKRDSSAIDDTTPGSTPEKQGTKSKRRCAVCKCKLELAQRTIGRCRCDNVFCSLHRLPELHQCDFDHKEDGRREAREKMVKPTRHLGTSFKRLDSDS